MPLEGDSHQAQSSEPTGLAWVPNFPPAGRNQQQTLCPDDSSGLGGRSDSVRSHGATRAAVEGGEGPGPHRVFCLGDPDDEDQLGEEERPDEVLVDAVQVGAERLHQRQEHEGHQQGGQRQGHGGVGDDLQGQDLSVLRAGWLEAGEHVRATARMELLHNQDTVTYYHCGQELA